jgi:hypothetical protein
MAYGTKGAVTADRGTDMRTGETVKPLSIGKVSDSLGEAKGVAARIWFGRLTTGIGTVRFIADRGVAVEAATGKCAATVALPEALFGDGFA